MVAADPPIAPPPARGRLDAGAEPVVVGARHLAGPGVTPRPDRDAVRPGRDPDRGARSSLRRVLHRRRHLPGRVRAPVLPVRDGADAAAETLRLPGCHLSSIDSSRVECNNRAVIQLNDTVYEANGGCLPAPRGVFTLPLLRGRSKRSSAASLGKQMTGIRVVTPNGQRIGLWRSTVRWLLFLVDGPLTLFLCGIITSAVSKGHRRPRRHGGRHLRGAPRRRRTTGSPRVTTAADQGLDLSGRGGATRRSGARRSTCWWGRPAPPSGVNQCASAISCSSRSISPDR